MTRCYDLKERLEIVRGDATALNRGDATIVLTESLAAKLFGQTDPIGRVVAVLLFSIENRCVAFVFSS